MIRPARTLIMELSNVEPNSGGREARVAHLDLIRGMALLGIIIANMALVCVSVHLYEYAE